MNARAEAENPVQKLDHRIHENLATVRERIVVFSGKGGVGKTTVAVNLAFALAGNGNRVGLIDADVTGPDVPKMVGLVEGPTKGPDGRMVPPRRNGVKVMSLASLIPADSPVLWRGPLRSKALDQFLGDVTWGPLDQLIADLPPGTGDEVMTMAKHMRPQAAVVVTTPQEMSLIDGRRAVNMAKRMGIERIGVVENMSGLRCPDCGRLIDVFGSGGGEQLARELGVAFLGRLPLDLKARDHADRGRPIVSSDPSAEISRVFLEIADRVTRMIEGENSTDVRPARSMAGSSNPGGQQ
jgi:ATP-binding protein involved in chromosome partitioning